MKKLLLTTVASLATLMAIASSGNAQDWRPRVNETVVLTGAGITVWGPVVACVARAGMKARFIGRGNTIGPLIEVLDGPQRGCTGNIRRWQVENYEEPDWRSWVNETVVLTGAGITVWGTKAMCIASAGTKARYVGRGNNVGPLIAVLEGPQRGCTGNIRQWQIARYEEPDSQALEAQEIFTTGKWGADVPVFKTQRDYFNARDRNKIENVVCRLKKGQRVMFVPYLNWGLGEVTHSNCKGWIDRGVVR